MKTRILYKQNAYDEGMFYPQHRWCFIWLSWPSRSEHGGYHFDLVGNAAMFMRNKEIEKLRKKIVKKEVVE